MQKVQRPIHSSFSARQCNSPGSARSQLPKAHVSWAFTIGTIHPLRKKLAEHGYCFIPKKSIKHCCTAFACTATRTATPTNFSDTTQHATNRTELFPARYAHGRTPANRVCRVPPSATFITFIISECYSSHCFADGATFFFPFFLQIYPSKNLCPSHLSCFRRCICDELIPVELR